MEGSTEAGSTSEEGTGKHRLQRQMAQSRKTFRFRKSRYGGDVKPTSPEKTISLIDIEQPQAQSTSATTPSSTCGTPMRQLQVPLIPEEDHSGGSSPINKSE